MSISGGLYVSLEFYKRIANVSFISPLLFCFISFCRSIFVQPCRVAIERLLLFFIPRWITLCPLQQQQKTKTKTC